MKFSYVVFDAKKKVKKGIIEAQSLREATKLLISQGWYIRKIYPARSFSFGFSLRGVSVVEKVLFVKHLGTMIKSGIALSEALDVIAEQTASNRFRRIVEKLSDKVKSGQSLSASLATYPNVFDPFITNIIEIGESSGTLEENLDYLAHALEDRLDLRRNIKTAAFYPSIVLMATFALGLILAYFVLPRISRLFKSMNFQLPLPTKILIFAAEAMDKYGIFIVFGVIGFFILMIFVLRLKISAPFWHYFLIKAPLISPIVINYNLVIATRTLGVLLKSGVTIDQAIVITVNTTTNFYYRQVLNKSLTQVQKGNKFSDALVDLDQSKRKSLFPILVVKMISVGERSGRLDESLLYLADYYQKEVDNQTKNLTTVLEPLLLIFVGLVVGFIAISIIMPIYQVTAQMGR